MSLLSLSHISHHYGGAGGPVLHDVSVTVAAGQRVGIVGESGSGKSTLGKIALGLLPLQQGTRLFDGRPLAPMGSAAWRAERRQMQMVSQDPYAAFNPRRTLMWQMQEVVQVHMPALARDRAASEAKIAQICASVGLDIALTARYPHQLSGGQLQRMSIARALLLEPRLLVCDESVASLDVSVQAQVLNRLDDISRETGIAMLFISHDLAVVRHFCSHIVVLQHGRVVEEGPCAQVFANPQADYTRMLIAAIPRLPDDLRPDFHADAAPAPMPVAERAGLLPA